MAPPNDSHQEVPIAHLPRELLADITRSISDFTVGFVKLRETSAGRDAVLLGSGTLVRIGAIRAILSAHHVVERLPRIGRFGLILSRREHDYTLDVAGVYRLKIGRGAIDIEGPDLAAVLLSSQIGSTLAGMKSFYDLESRQDSMLRTPPDRRSGIWANVGFVGERTVDEPGRSGFQTIKRFAMLGGFGGPERGPTVRGRFDYIAMPATYGGESVAPLSFGGMSGGGLWQILLRQDARGMLSTVDHLLSGVVFYQTQRQGDRREVICHGPQSVYSAALEAISNGAAP
ncbi:MAG: hypothetical protein RLO46_18680 [Pseudomonadales bacterium]